MTKKAFPVTSWLLKNSPSAVRKLERDEFFVIVGDSKRLGLSNVRLLVPKGIEVYRAIKEFRNKGEIFFTTLGDRDNALAYCSYINTDPGENLNYMINVGRLLEYPWYDHQTSSSIFDRLLNSGKKSNLYLVDSFRKDVIHTANYPQQEEIHPFLRRN